jgi:arylsulfatase A-like enzyme
VKHNLLLLTIDSLRADHLGCYGYARETSPHIDGVAREGAVFRRAVSHGGGTPEAFPAILAGADPPMLPDDFYRGIAGRPTLAAVLRQAGYYTAALHSNPFLSRAFHYAHGFDIFDDGTDSWGVLRGRRMLEGESVLGRLAYRLAVITSGPPIVCAHDLVKKASPRLAREPFFLWLHFMDTHLPYMPPRAYQRHFGPPVSRARQLALHYQVRRGIGLATSARQTLCNLYDSCIRVVDDAIGELLAAAVSVRDRTVVAVVADHGDGFGEHGEYGHYLSLHEELVRVPLILSGPGLPRREIAEPVALGDLPVTLLRLMGEGDGGLPGGDLFVARSQPIISVSLDPRRGRRSIACRCSGWKYIRLERLDGAVERAELYRDLSAELPERCQRMDEALETFLRRGRERSRETERIRERARALRHIQRL